MKLNWNKLIWNGAIVLIGMAIFVPIAVGWIKSIWSGIGGILPSSPTSLFGYGVGGVVLILLVSGAWSHFKGPGNGARYAVTFVTAIAFSIAVLGVMFHIGTNALYGNDAEEVRSAVTKIVAEAIDPRLGPAGEPTPAVMPEMKNIAWFSLDIMLMGLGVLIIFLVMFLPGKSKPAAPPKEKKGGH